VALCVNADETYAKVEAGGEVYILAEALAEKALPAPFTVLETFKGASLEHTEYEPLFGFGDAKEKANYVVCDGYVTLTDGTGIVHIAPAFGDDDARVGRKYGLPYLQLVDPTGRMTEEATPFAGLFVKDADPEIIKFLGEKGSLFAALDYEHSYPFCWRCDTALIYYARSGWFIEMSKLRAQLTENNNKVNWMPDNIRTGRFGNFLEGAVDWAVSRERYWGTPMPLWECDCGYRHAIGSRIELDEMRGSAEYVELHKPYIDAVMLNCPECKGKMKRTPEVIDCWFDAGAMPFAQWSYPHKNKEIFDKYFPADFISEAIDQTRGWFYTLLAISTLLFDAPPYKNVIVLGHVQDKNGQKMSKHVGNVVDPWDVLNKQGADALRWYFYSSSQPWLPNRFHDDILSEGQRKFMGTLWNTCAFYTLYADIDGFDVSKYTLDFDNLPLMDKWVLSRLNNLIKTVDEGLGEYRITETARALGEFTDELSNWYVRRCRERFWGNGIYKDKIDAYMTLYTVLTVTAKLSAPYTPFMAEAIYQTLVIKLDKDAPESIHLCDFPVCDDKFIDKNLESDMGLVLQTVALGRAARSAAGIKTRQPAARLMVQAEREFSDLYKQIAAEELNVKEVAFVADASGYTSYTFKPQLKTLGPKYGKLLGKISAYLSNVDGVKFMEELKGGGASFEIDSEKVELTIDDVLYETAQTAGFSAASDRGVTVVIDTKLTPELIEEGFVREIISKLQTMRKEAGFEVLDKITVYYQADEKLSAVFERNADEIKKETLAVSVVKGGGGYSKEWDINGEKAVLGVER
jgi:isoleucyl-tRNA synthetase